jgi:hypothetical protein
MCDFEVLARVLSRGSPAVVKRDVTLEAKHLHAIYFSYMLDSLYNDGREDNSPDLIVDHDDGRFKIFLGNRDHAMNREQLQGNNIGHVLNVGGSSLYPDSFHREKLGLSDLRYKCIEADDVESYDISANFDEAMEFIRQARALKDGNILIHCAAGVSRSATIVTAYLMIEMQHRTAASALGYVSERRRIIAPNQGFIKQLLNLEMEISHRENRL